MGIPERKNTTVAFVDKPITEEIHAPHGSTFTALVPESRIENIIKYTDGFPLNTDYYRAVTSSKSASDLFDPRNGSLAQSYTNIKDLTLSLNNEMDFSYNSETGKSEQGGSGVLPYGVKPEIGDVFIARMGTGEDAIFVVVDTQRLSEYKDSLYSIDFSLYVYVTQKPEYFTKLKESVISTLYYNNDVGVNGQQLLIEPETKKHNDLLKSFLRNNRQWYFNTFSQMASSTISLPTDGSMIIDPRFLKFIFRTNDVSKYNLKNANQYSMDGSVDFNRECVLDCFMTGVMPNPKRIDTKAIVVNTKVLLQDSFLSVTSFLAVPYIIYPYVEDRYKLSNGSRYKNVNASGNAIDNNNYYACDLYVRTLGSEGETSLKLLPDLFVDDYYILSEQFYDYLQDRTKFDDLTFFELIVYSHFKKEAVSKPDLLKLIDNWEDWSPLHQYYLLPIIWLIIRKTLGVF